jgi:hypothetical protein
MNDSKINDIQISINKKNKLLTTMMEELKHSKKDNPYLAPIYEEIKDTITKTHKETISAFNKLHDYLSKLEVQTHEQKEKDRDLQEIKKELKKCLAEHHSPSSKR